MENDGAIELRRFLKTRKYDSLVDAMKADSVVWKLKGPANKCRYHVLADDQPQAAGQLLQSFKNVLASKFFTQLLERMTGVKLASCHAEIRKFSQGDYTL